MRFEFTPENKRLYDRETGKEYMFHGECYIGWHEESHSFLYESLALGPLEITEKSIELVYASDKNHVLMTQLSSLTSTTAELADQLQSFLDMTRICLQIPSLDKPEFHANCLELVTRYNAELESFLVKPVVDRLPHLLLVAFQIGELYRKVYLSYCKKWKDAEKAIDQTKELTVWFEKVFAQIPNDYKGGKDGPFTAVYSEYKASCSESISLSSFYRYYLPWMRRHVQDRLREIYGSIMNFPYSSNEDEFHIFEMSRENYSDCYEQLKKQPGRFKAYALIRWIENYRNIIFQD